MPRWQVSLMNLSKISKLGTVQFVRIMKMYRKSLSSNVEIFRVTSFINLSVGLLYS
jgi:hypothetical protein